jgi:hypothetical protein
LASSPLKPTTREFFPQLNPYVISSYATCSPTRFLLFSYYEYA